MKYKFHSYEISSEEDIAEALGIDYEDVLKARAEEAALVERDPELGEAFQALRRETMRAMLGL